MKKAKSVKKPTKTKQAYKKGEIIFLRLVGGEDLMAEFLSIDTKTRRIVVKQALRVIYLNNSDMEHEISSLILSRWLPTFMSETQIVDLDLHQVLLHHVPEPAITGYYNKTLEIIMEHEATSKAFTDIKSSKVTKGTSLPAAVKQHFDELVSRGNREGFVEPDDAEELNQTGRDKVKKTLH